MTGWLVICGSHRRHVRTFDDLWNATKGGALHEVRPLASIPGRRRGQACGDGHRCCLVGCDHTHLFDVGECPRCRPDDKERTSGR